MRNVTILHPRKTGKKAMTKQKIHGFAKRFSQALVLIAKITSRMTRPTDIFVPIALHKVVFSHTLKKIVFLSKNTKHHIKKQTYDCSAALELGSCDRSMVGNRVCNKNVIHNTGARGDDRDQKIPGRCSSSGAITGVYTRVFYNSKVSKRDVEGLIARGNRVRFLRPGNVTSGKKHSSLRDVGKYNSRIVTNKCMVYSSTPLTPAPPPSNEKGGPKTWGT